MLNFLDILTASPHYFCKKFMEMKKENLKFATVVLKGRGGLIVSTLNRDAPDFGVG